MQSFPHHYRAAITTDSDSGRLSLRAPGVPDLETDAPAEYDGPGDRWSPETLVMGAVADCYVLTFRAIARASNLEWQELVCEVEGTLDKVDRAVQFTHIHVHAEAKVPAESESRVERILRKSEESCLVTNSLKATVEFSCRVTVI